MIRSPSDDADQSSWSAAAHEPHEKAPSRLSDAQRTAIGLARRADCFHWLQAKDPSPVDETCWKSKNVSLAFEGAVGNDGLGYDFEMPRKKGSIMYEVKATTSDAGMIPGDPGEGCARA